MGLFDALSGRIEHFNSIAVPVHNKISLNIKNLEGGTEKLFFALAFGLIAQKSIDFFFRTDTGQTIKEIKKYNQHHFEQLYAIFTIWAFYDFCSYFNSSERNKLENKLQTILELNENEFNYYFEKLNHKIEMPIGIEKLWEEVAKVIFTIPNTQENYLVFHQGFSKICKEAYQEFEQILNLSNQ